MWITRKFVSRSWRPTRLRAGETQMCGTYRCVKFNLECPGLKGFDVDDVVAQMDRGRTKRANAKQDVSTDCPGEDGAKCCN
ncbi:hypothetical protein CY35_06G091500 [Sphagnum magellanicum]|nr:hypothetical protein CY35_06G091500 [Sphagnum magellanicum]